MKSVEMLFAIPAFFLLIGLEFAYSKWKKKRFYRLNDTVTNLNIGVGQQVLNLFSKGLILTVYVGIGDNWALFPHPPGILSFILCLVLFDFLFYWAHRWGHEVNLFWGAHVVHHQSEEFNLSVALRQSWFHNLMAFWIFLPIPFLGFPKEIFLPAAAANTLYQFWIHTEAINKMPRWFEFIFNTPSHHRVHHGINPKYIDKNHGGMFIIWDRLFGTFKEEEERPTYGITTQFRSWNPTWANLHYYWEMFQSARKMSRWKDRLKLIFARPGWLPEEMGGYQAPPPVNKERKKYDRKNRKQMHLYVLLQFVIIVGGLLAYMYHFEEITPFYKGAFLLTLLLSVMICGGIFEGKSWVKYAEYARLILIVAFLNTYYYFWHPNWLTVMIVCTAIGLVGMAIFFTLSIRRPQQA